MGKKRRQNNWGQCHRCDNILLCCHQMFCHVLFVVNLNVTNIFPREHCLRCFENYVFVSCSHLIVGVIVRVHGPIFLAFFKVWLLSDQTDDRQQKCCCSCTKWQQELQHRQQQPKTKRLPDFEILSILSQKAIISQCICRSDPFRWTHTNVLVHVFAPIECSPFAMPFS